MDEDVGQADLVTFSIDLVEEKDVARLSAYDGIPVGAEGANGDMAGANVDAHSPIVGAMGGRSRADASHETAALSMGNMSNNTKLNTKLIRYSGK